MEILGHIADYDLLSVCYRSFIYLIFFYHIWDCPCGNGSKIQLVVCFFYQGCLKRRLKISFTSSITARSRQNRNKALSKPSGQREREYSGIYFTYDVHRHRSQYVSENRNLKLLPGLDAVSITVYLFFFQLVSGQPVVEGCSSHS